MPDDDDQAARRLPYTLTAALVGGSYLAIAHSTMTKPPRLVLPAARPPLVGLSGAARPSRPRPPEAARSRQEPPEAARSRQEQRHAERAHSSHSLSVPASGRVSFAERPRRRL